MPALWPGVVLLAVAAGDLLDGSRRTILGLMAVVPLLAAVLLGVRPTLAYGLAALLATGLVGLVNHVYHGSGLVPQVERLVAVVLFSGVAGVAARTRQRREEELRTARTVATAVQLLLLPDPAARIGSLRFAASYESASHSARVGGDLYSVVPTKEGARLLVADVSGKGLGAARMAAVVLGCFRERAAEASVAELLAMLDAAVCRESGDDEHFVTAALAELDQGGTRIDYWLAGHPPPLLVRSSETRLLSAERRGRPLGLAIGLLPGLRTRQALALGDRLVFYTDGTSEAVSPAKASFPLESELSQLMSASSIGEALDATQRRIRAFQGGALRDDAALLAVEVTG